MANWAQDLFTPKNPGKYVGNTPPYYRSSWELTFMIFCDQHPNIVKWASEPIRIPYMNPITGKQTVYVPDFIVEYVDAKGARYVEMVEVKPASQTHIKQAKSKKDKIALAINAAKWQAASAYCERNGIKLRIITEDDIFARSLKKKRK